MLEKKSISIILLLVVVFALSGCGDKYSGSLNPPDKINLYVNGNHKQITKNGEEVDQTLFNRINELVEVRIPKDFSTIQSALTDNDIKEVKGYAVEFIYNKPQSITIEYGEKKKIEFTEIVFPLTDKWQNIAFIKEKDSYTPIGLRENLDHLVKASL